MTDLEARLRDHLADRADSLPPPSDRFDRVVRRGRRRRLRNLATGSLAGLGLMVVAALTIDLGPLDPSGTIVADESPAAESDGPDPPSPEPAPFDEPSPDPGSSTTTTPPTTTPPTTSPTTSSSSSSSTTSPVVSSSPPTSPAPLVVGDPAPVTIATPTAAFDSLPADAVLFRADHEGCQDLTDPRAHPQWIEGQPSDGRNGDGTATNGFVYTTGDATAGHIDWRFTPRAGAPSGNCVAALTLTRADDPASTDAVRLVRRYDDTGRPLPADAFYSAWILIPDEITFDDRATVEGRTVFGFWTIMSFKNHVPVEAGSAAGSGQSLTTFSLGAGRTTDQDAMALTVYDRSGCGASEDCPDAAALRPIRDVALPSGRWVHIEVGLRSRPDGGGRLQVWQDGELVVDHTGPTERVGAQRRTWSLNHSGRLHDRSRHTLYLDDVVISTEPLRPLLFGSGD